MLQNTGIDCISRFCRIVRYQCCCLSIESEIQDVMSSHHSWLHHLAVFLSVMSVLYIPCHCSENSLESSTPMSVLLQHRLQSSVSNKVDEKWCSTAQIYTGSPISSNAHGNTQWTVLILAYVQVTLPYSLPLFLPLCLSSPYFLHIPQSHICT